LAVLVWAARLESPKLPLMTQSLAVTGIPTEAGVASRPGMQAAMERQEFSLKPCSRIRGRERWYVHGLMGNTWLASAVELVLKGESGVQEVVANPLTGRVLVRYLPDQVQASVEVLIRRALTLAPLIESEISRPVTPKPFLLSKRLFTAELGCSLFKLLFLGGVSCPVGGIWCAAGAIITFVFSVQRSL
jgi:hypothetical protein